MEIYKHIHLPVWFWIKHGKILYSCRSKQYHGYSTGRATCREWTLDFPRAEYTSFDYAFGSTELDFLVSMGVTPTAFLEKYR